MKTTVEAEQTWQVKVAKPSRTLARGLTEYRRKFPQYNATTGAGVECWDPVKASWLARDEEITEMSRFDVKAGTRNLHINGVYKPSEAALEGDNLEHTREVEHEKWLHEISSTYPVVFGLVSRGRRVGGQPERVLLYGAYRFRNALLTDEPIKAVILDVVQTKSVALNH